ncbi:hypothetical protein AAFF_G00109780 [Aldrovandia affinis]|uniref:Nuclear receptor coactivator 7 n=1 Tax=Aldrovandia affinis TaxID=143900 RepID=A0AAD7WBW1_9TELE|nr:hypothetical protein AAFF_G00109780 [Aldrovandia affinis]
MMYKALVISHLDYCNSLLAGLPASRIRFKSLAPGSRSSRSRLFCPDPSLVERPSAIVHQNIVLEVLKPPPESEQLRYRTLSVVREDLGRSLFWETEDTTRPQTHLATEHSQNRWRAGSREAYLSLTAAGILWEELIQRKPKGIPAKGLIHLLKRRKQIKQGQSQAKATGQNQSKLLLAAPPNPTQELKEKVPPSVPGSDTPADLRGGSQDEGCPRSPDGIGSSSKMKRDRRKPPGTVDYTVAPQDTLNSIALKFNITPNKLVQLNRLFSRSVVAGQILFVPDVDQSGPSLESSSEQDHVKRLDFNPLWGEVKPLHKTLSPPSEDEELMTVKFLKMSCRYFTDGMGVVGGVMIVTPNNIMFDPHKSDPLVIEHGCEEYGLICPMEEVVSIALYDDISRMELKDALPSDVPQDLCPVYRPGAWEDLPSDRDFNPFSRFQTRPILLDHIDAIVTDTSDPEAVEKSSPDEGFTELEEESPPPRGHAQNHPPSDSMTEKEEGQDAPTGQSNLPHRSLHAGDFTAAEHAVKCVRETACTTDQTTDTHTTGTDQTTDMHTTGTAQSTDTHTTGTAQSTDTQTTGTAQMTDMHTTGTDQTTDMHTTGRDQTTDMHTTGTAQTTDTQTTGTDQTTDTHTTWTDQTTDMHTTGRDQTTDMHTTGTAQSTDTHTTGTAQTTDMHTTGTDQTTDTHTTWTDQTTDMHTTGRDQTTDTHTTGTAQMTDTHTTWTYQTTDMHTTGRDQTTDMHTTGTAQTTGTHTTGTDQVIDAHTTGTDQVIDAHTTGTEKLLNGETDLHSDVATVEVTGDQRRKLRLCEHAGDSGKCSQQRPNPAKELLNGEGATPGPMSEEAKRRQRNEEEMKSWLNKRIQGPIEDMLLAKEDKSKTPPMFLCFKVGKPMRKSFAIGRMTSPAHQYGRRGKQPEYWFAVPQERVDHLYAFFVQWSPDVYGKDSREPGFVVVEKEELDMIDNFFSDPTPKGWEIITVNEAKRRQSVGSLDYEEPLDLLPELSDHSLLLQEAHIEKLANHLPARTQGYPWQLVYGTAVHGTSLKTLYRNLAELDCPVLLVIKDMENQVFGAFSTHPFRVSEHCYGTGETFLFSFNPEIKVFRWSGENSYFVKGNTDSLQLGEGVGLWLDADLYHGSSSTCSTFRNQPLSAEQDFTVQGLEVWAFHVKEGEGVPWKRVRLSPSVLVKESSHSESVSGQQPENSHWKSGGLQSTEFLFFLSDPVLLSELWRTWRVSGGTWDKRLVRCFGGRLRKGRCRTSQGPCPRLRSRGQPEPFWWLVGRTRQVVARAVQGGWWTGARTAGAMQHERQTT